MGIEPLIKCTFGHGSRFLINRLPVVEQYQEWNSTNSKSTRCQRIHIGVDLCNREVIPFRSDLIEYGCNHLARATPRGPKVNENPLASTRYRFKIRIRCFNEIACHIVTSHRVLLAPYQPDVSQFHRSRLENRVLLPEFRGNHLDYHSEHSNRGFLRTWKDDG